MTPQSITLPSQLAAALRERRGQLGITQAEAAANVGLLPKTISSLESKPERSSIDSLLKLLAALNLRIILEPRDAGDTDGSEW